MGKSVPLEVALAECERDPEFTARDERLAVADAVSVWLVGYRAAHHLSQRQLAAMVGMKQAAIARLEIGDVEPRLSTLLRLARALDTDLHVMLSRAAVAVAEPAQAA
jgi:DNA-binding XRE family transcriptional regulator